jgi:endonuclease/exonuclease/phosphatase (EEP) superfamily protein YafD
VIAPPERGSRLLRALAGLLTLYPVAFVALTAISAIFDIRRGVLALLQIFLPHFFIAGIVGALGLVPLAVATRHRPLTIALAVAGTVGVLRFGPEWVSLPRSESGGSVMRVVSWNLLAGSRSAQDAVDVLLAHPADVVGLQELTPDVAEALAADPRITDRYPHQVLEPQRGVLGIGLLSAYPILESETSADPVMVVARIDMGAAGEVVVLNAHPLPGNIRTGGPLGIPWAFDARRRDEAIVRVRERIDAVLNSGARLVVIGDYNVTSTEPAFGELAAGLHDAHAEVGLGPGWTWRPEPLDGLRIGLIRIDHVLTSEGITPLTSSVDCGPPGDHCLVEASIELR